MHSHALPKPPPSSRFLTVLFVVAIHCLAIYGLLLALKPSWISPPQHGPIVFTPIPPVPPPATSPVTSNIPRTIPGIYIPSPIIDIAPTDPGPRPTPPSSGGDGISDPNIPNGPMLDPVRPIANTHTTPAYPPIAARLNEQGSVQLSLIVDERGYVADAAVLTSSGYGALDAAAVAWVKAYWRYQPARRDGVPTTSRTEAIVTFRLMGGRG